MNEINQLKNEIGLTFAALVLATDAAEKTRLSRALLLLEARLRARGVN